jgi:hypothetical protein
MSENEVGGRQRLQYIFRWWSLTPTGADRGNGAHLGRPNVSYWRSSVMTSDGPKRLSRLRWRSYHSIDEGGFVS